MSESVETQPHIEDREALHYVAIAAEPSNERELRAAVDGAFPELFAWLGAHSIAPGGPPLIRYLSFDAARRAGGIEIGVEVGEDARDAADERVVAGVVPAGSYATVVHVGPYTHATEPDLGGAHAALVAWAQRSGIALAEGSGGFVERYLLGPESEADYSKWRTELIYALESR